MAEAKGSLRHLRWYVNQAPDQLDAAVFTASPSLAATASGRPVWRSPLASAGYLECWNERFLDRLGIMDRLDDFRAFWPFQGAGTPHWDALARIPLASDKFGAVMVEGKAHRGELWKPNDASGATPTSLAKIQASCQEARDFYGVPASAPAWEAHHYQVCNRLAHLYWMNTIAEMPTWLLWVFIIDDPAWPADRLPAHDWHPVFEDVKTAIGLPAQHRLADRVSVIYLPASPEE